MGRLTNYSKEYLLFKSMVYVEEYGMKSITARDMADFCGVYISDLYTFQIDQRVKGENIEEITVCFERYLAECNSNDVLSTVYLLKDFFLSMKVSVESLQNLN